MSAAALTRNDEHDQALGARSSGPVAWTTSDSSQAATSSGRNPTVLPTRMKPMRWWWVSP